MTPNYLLLFPCSQLSRLILAFNHSLSASEEQAANFSWRRATSRATSAWTSSLGLDLFGWRKYNWARTDVWTFGSTRTRSLDLHTPYPWRTTVVLCCWIILRGNIFIHSSLARFQILPAVTMVGRSSMWVVEVVDWKKIWSTQLLIFLYYAASYRN